MRVVLDTNVILSACMKPAGLEAELTRMATAGALRLAITDEIEAEYRDVLSRPKFASFHAAAEVLLAKVSDTATRVRALHRVAAALDEDDNRFLECAEAFAADYLITGNLRDYPPAWRQTKITNARGFFERAAGA